MALRTTQIILDEQSVQRPTRIECSVSGKKEKRNLTENFPEAVTKSDFTVFTPLIAFSTVFTPCCFSMLHLASPKLQNRIMFFYCLYPSLSSDFLKSYTFSQRPSTESSHNEGMDRNTCRSETIVKLDFLFSHRDESFNCCLSERCFWWLFRISFPLYPLIIELHFWKLLFSLTFPLLLLIFSEILPSAILDAHEKEHRGSWGVWVAVCVNVDVS